MTDSKPDPAEDSFVEGTRQPISIVEVGNQVLAPLMAGLEYAHNGRPFGMSVNYSSLATGIPLGTPKHHTASFTNPASRRTPPRPDGITLEDDVSYKIAPYTEALAMLHDQVVDIGFKTGNLLDIRRTLPDLAGTPLTERIAEHSEQVSEALTPEKLPMVPLVIPVKGGGAPIEVEVPNILIGPRNKSLAHVMMAIGLAGETVKSRNRVVGNFMYEATGGFIESLPPLQMAIHRHLDAELAKRGHDGKKILLEAGCDLDRSVVQEAFDKLLPYAEIYEMGCQLRGQSKPDYMQKAFRQMRKYCHQEVKDLKCGDGYQCGMLLEGMIDHAILRSHEKERAPLLALKESFAVKARAILQNAPGYAVESGDISNVIGDAPVLASVEQVMALPEAGKIVEAFADCYAADILLERAEGSLTDKAWNLRVRSESPAAKDR
jgi:hypothetical protein